MLDAAAAVIYQESPMAHTIDPKFIPRLAAWLGDVL
jgi:hypothetical protein